MAPLSSAVLEQWRETGAVIVEGVLESALVQAAAAEAEAAEHRFAFPSRDAPSTTKNTAVFDDAKTQLCSIDAAFAREWRCEIESKTREQRRDLRLERRETRRRRGRAPAEQAFHRR